MQKESVRYICYIGDTFCCPFCETKYNLQWLDAGSLTPFAYPVDGKPCEHLEPFLFPAHKDDEDNGYKFSVKFTPPIEESAPLNQRLAYLLRSTFPFRAWLARMNPWDVLEQNPLAFFLGEALKPEMVWVTPEGAIYVRSRDGEQVFIPEPPWEWIDALVRELNKHKRRTWLALEVLAIIENINRAIY